MSTMHTAASPYTAHTAHATHRSCVHTCLLTLSGGRTWNEDLGSLYPALLPSPSQPASPIGLSLNVFQKKKKKKRSQVPRRSMSLGAGERTYAWAQEQGMKTSQAFSGRRPCLGRWPGVEGPWLQGDSAKCGALLLPCLSQGLLPTPWLLNEPLSVWSLLVLAPSSLWNQAQLPGKANRDRSFEEKELESWKRDQSEHYSSTHSLQKPLNNHCPHIWIWCTKMTCAQILYLLM